MHTDVHIFWLAIAASLRKLDSQDRDIENGLTHKVNVIVNERHKESMDNFLTDI